MKERIVSTFLMLLLASPFCYASGYTLAVANHIIAIFVIIVIALVVMGSYILRNNRIFRQRNEQLRRILTALDDYRAIVGNEALSLDEQEDLLKDKLAKSKKVNTIQKGEDQSFFVKMDARVNKEKPFTDPDFDYYALIKFMGISQDEFCRLVPRYKDPERTKDYINSLRAEYAAKLLMERSGSSMEDMVAMCGFKDAAAFNKAFKFSFGITPTEYLNTISQIFKNKV